jgi:hypothetical protein
MATDLKGLEDLKAIYVDVGRCVERVEHVLKNVSTPPDRMEFNFEGTPDVVIEWNSGLCMRVFGSHDNPYANVRADTKNCTVSLDIYSPEFLELLATISSRSSNTSLNTER